MSGIPTTRFSTGNSIPRLGYGTWLIGGTKTRDPRNDDAGQIRWLEQAIEAGFSWIRTAQNYAEGYCEELIAKAIKPLDRSKLFLSSCVNENFALNSNAVVEHAQASMRRLGTDYLDLYLVGGVNPEVPIREVADGLLELHEQGLVKDIGVANYRLEELEFIREYTSDLIVYDELHYNLIIREPELNGVLKYCQQNQVVFCAWRPLQLGQLCQPGIQILDEMAKKYSKSQAQIALKWVLSKEGVIALTKTLDPEHTREDIDIFDWELDTDDLARLDRDFPIQMRISDAVPPARSFKP
jgi:diketogulonate reductase-like aldo/keto reductase